MKNNQLEFTTISRIIRELAYATESDEKKIEVLQGALDSALNQLAMEPKALAAVAETVKDIIKDIAFSDCGPQKELLDNYINASDQPIILSTLGKRIAYIAVKVGNVSKLAAMAGVSESVIRKWKADDSEPTASRLVALAKAGNVSIEWLATGNTDGKGQCHGYSSDSPLDLINRIKDIVDSLESTVRQKSK